MVIFIARMKNQFFSCWTAIIVVLTLNFNLNQFVYAGDKAPKFRAEKVPAIKKVGRALFGPKKDEIKTPSVDDLAKNPTPNTSVRRYPCCKPTCAPKKPPLLTAEVPPPPPLLVAEVPPVPTPELLVAYVPEPVPLLEARVPEPYHPELLEAHVPSATSVLLTAEVPPPLPPIVNIIRLPCPPQPACIEDDVSYRKKVYVDRTEDRRIIVDRPVYVDQSVMYQPPQPYYQSGCYNGGHPGGHHQVPMFQGHPPGGFVGGHPHHQSGGGAYGIGQAIGHYNYDVGRGIGINNVNRSYSIGYGTVAGF